MDTSINQLKVLVAEDNDVNQRLALIILSRIGYEADLAEHGASALRMMLSNNYDIVFMDVNMPVMDGLEITETIRKTDIRQPVIIAMTANAIQGDRERCIDAGMNDYISKPFRAEELSRMMEKWAAQIRKEN